MDVDVLGVCLVSAEETYGPCCSWRESGCELVRDGQIGVTAFGAGEDRKGR